MNVTNNDIFEIKWRQKTASLYDPSHIVMADQLIYCMEKMKKVFEKVTEYDEFFDLKEHTLDLFSAQLWYIQSIPVPWKRTPSLKYCWILFCFCFLWKLWFPNLLYLL